MRYSLLVIAAVAVPAAAAPIALGWEQLSAEAARANPALAASRLERDASRASYYGSFNGVLPRVDLSNSASQSDAARRPAWSAQASASISLLDAGELASIAASRASLRAAEASLRAASAELRAALRRAYSRALAAEQSAEVARRILALRQHDAELVELRYGSGRESKGNALRARAQALQARVAAEQSERELASARQELARRLGREDFSTAVASGTLGASRPPEPAGDFVALLALRTDVGAAEAGVARARAGLRSAQAPLFPSLSASYTRARSGGAEFPSERYSWSAGATLRYSLFGGGPTAALQDARAARFSLEAAEASLRAARGDALADLRSSWAEFADAWDQVRVSQALLEAARQRNDEADVRYASGLLNFDNWELIVSDRVSAERAAVSARRAAMDAETAWDRALGRALGE